jgi:hypothetical protein
LVPRFWAWEFGPYEVVSEYTTAIILGNVALCFTSSFTVTESSSDPKKLDGSG